MRIFHSISMLLLSGLLPISMVQAYDSGGNTSSSIAGEVCRSVEQCDANSLQRAVNKTDFRYPCMNDLFPLARAVQIGCSSAVQILLSTGVDTPQNRVYNIKALTEAVKKNDLTLVKKMMSLKFINGCIEQKGSNCAEAFDYAIYGHKIEILKELLRYFNFPTYLWWDLIQHDKKDDLRLLFSLGVISDNDMRFAAWNDFLEHTPMDLEIAHMFLQAGAKVNEVLMYDETALEIAIGRLRYTEHCTRTLKGRYTPELIRLLIQFGANPNQVDIYGKTILHKIATHECADTWVLDSIKALLEGGADKSIQDMYDKRPIDYSDVPEIRSLLK